MNSMKHTPGPWEVDNSGTLTGINGAHIGSISNLDDFPCADAEEMHPETREEVEAEYAGNARLIAAAPELLNLLKKAAGLLMDGADGEGFDEEAIKAECYALIRKLEVRES